MKNNYREALQRAQKGTTIRPPKKYQSQGGVPAAPSAPVGPSANTSVIPMEGSQGSYDVNTGVFPGSQPVNRVNQMAQIGKENYMSALKTFKKGGSK